MGVARSIISIIIGAAAVISLLVTAARTSGSGSLARGVAQARRPDGPHRGGVRDRVRAQPDVDLSDADGGETAAVADRRATYRRHVH
jgi:hypothetical protein